ncbi:sugar transporter [Tropicibacter sp. S64]|uniref:sugar transporter n=1 Tax=Tropicibacter sp. S64 TaxID=3415122 RepID=UPI003C7D8C9A
MAQPARMKRRHWGLVLSFGLMVLVPLVLVLLYMWLVAEDQYASSTGFTVRQEEDGGASAVLGGLAQLAGGSTSADGDILHEFILSQALVQTIDEKVGLRDHYSAHWSTDPVFALSPDATLEELQEYWQRIVRISYDQGSGLMDVRVLAYDPDKAQQIAQQIILEGQAMINALNDQAREDAMRYAEIELDEAVARLKEAREALTNFRTRTTIVDPDADLQGRMGVMNGLQQQLAAALIEYDLLREQTSEDDPRITQVRRRIEAIRNRIAEERRAFTSDTTANSTDGEDYPTLIAEYEGLVVDREFAEESYRATLAAVDVARAKASRQSRYLATYVPPTRAESSEYPQRLTISALAGLFLLLVWSICALVYYSIRDRR